MLYILLAVKRRENQVAVLRKSLTPGGGSLCRQQS